MLCGARARQVDLGERYVHSLYWALATTSSLGFGNGPKPASVAEYVFAICSQVLPTIAATAPAPPPPRHRRRHHRRAAIIAPPPLPIPPPLSSRCVERACTRPSSATSPS